MFHHSPGLVGSVLKPDVGWSFLNDKDGGFTLVHEDYVPKAHMEVLNSLWYREVDPEMYRGECVAKQHKNLCACVECVMEGGDGVARNLFRSLASGCLFDCYVGPHCQVSQWCWIRDVPQHAQFGLLQSGRFVPVGSSRAQNVAAHATSSPQGHTPVCEAHEYHVCET